jgi:hypothetical protein
VIQADVLVLLFEMSLNPPPTNKNSVWKHLKLGPKQIKVWFFFVNLMYLADLTSDWSYLQCKILSKCTTVPASENISKAEIYEVDVTNLVSVFFNLIDFRMIGKILKLIPK